MQAKFSIFNPDKGKLTKMDGWNDFKKIIVHLSVWLLVIIVNIILVSNYPNRPKLGFHLFTWLIYFLVFYFNFLLLMPYLLFRKHFLPFILFSVLLVSGAYFSKEEIRDLYFPFPENRMERPEGEISRMTEKDSEIILELREKIPAKERRDRFSQGGRNRGKVFSLSSIFLIYTLSFAFRLYLRLKENENKIKESEKEKIITELNLLKSQVNPHFLFNSLNSIYSLANRKSDNTTEAVLKLSEILRYMIYDSERSKVTLVKELENIENYVELQKLRLTGKTKIVLNTGEHSRERYMLEPLLLMPLVENAFKYGSDNFHNSYIAVSIKVVDSILIFNCENRIVNPGANSGKQSGMGLKNVRRRLELLYPDNFILEIKSKKDIFTVHLELNLGESELTKNGRQITE